MTFGVLMVYMRHPNVNQQGASIMTSRHAHTLNLSIGYDMSEASRLHLIDVKPASERSVDIMLRAPIESMDGKSNWLWFRLPNGDLIFGCYPEGETYFETEDDH